MGTTEYSDYGSNINNCKIYGDYEPSKDCPPDESFCTNVEKHGLFASVNTLAGGKGFQMHPIESMFLPLWRKSVHEGGWGAKAQYTNNHFKGFLKKTQGGKN